MAQKLAQLITDERDFGSTLEGIISASVNEIVKKTVEEVVEEAKPTIARMVIRSLPVIKGDQGPQGEKGESGKTPIKGKDYFTSEEINEFLLHITPQKGIHYFDGKDGKDGTDGENGKDGKDGKDGSPDTPQHIRNKLMSLRGNERLDVSAIKNLPSQNVLYKKRLGRGTGSAVQAYDLSALLDSSTKTFTIPENARVLQIVSSSTPFVFRPTVDFITTSNSITFDAAVDAATMLQSGQSLIILYVEK